jgi:uncharacterized RDD family membrane protein YckC
MIDFNETPNLAPDIARRCEIGSLLLRRWLGCWVDLVVLIALIAPPAMLPSAPFGDAALTAGIVAALLYFPITEGLWGRSLGKLATGMIVVNEAGRPPGLGRALVRTLTRLIEVNPLLFGGLPAGLLVLLTEKRQRLGDLLAGTYVLPSRLVADALAGRPPEIPIVSDQPARPFWRPGSLPGWRW